MCLNKLSAALAVIAFATAAFGFDENAESGTRMVQGTVTASDASPVNGATVLLNDTRTLQIRSFVTKEDGAYHFAGLSTNHEYEVQAEHNGASSGKKRLDVFDDHKVATINLKLKK